MTTTKQLRRSTPRHPFVAHPTEIDLCITCGHGQTHRFHDTEAKARWFMVTKSPRTSYILGGIWVLLAVAGILVRITDDAAPSWFDMLYTIFQAAAGGYYLAAARAHADSLRAEQRVSETT